MHFSLAQNGVNLDPGSPIPCVCPPNYFDIVCGTDGHDYRNGCYLICASRKNPQLTVLKRGSCGVPNRPPVIKRQPCLCPYYLDPVCGTDYRTYPNDCEFNCEKGYNINLRVLKRGPCQGGRFSPTR